MKPSIPSMQHVADIVVKGRDLLRVRGKLIDVRGFDLARLYVVSFDGGSTIQSTVACCRDGVVMQLHEAPPPAFLSADELLRDVQLLDEAQVERN